MPHERKRHIEALLRHNLSASPIVAIFGHRQVGKTTLASRLGKQLYSLDNPSQLKAIERDPLGFLEDSCPRGRLVIDECQMLPSLFPALKEYVRLHPKKGQIILTGSVRFSSRQSIRESMTGRYIHTELLPFDLCEIEERQLSTAVVTLLRSQDLGLPLKVTHVFNAAKLEKFLKRGTMPAFFSRRDESHNAQFFETQIDTMLNRDLRLLFQTKLSYQTLKNICTELARLQGRSIDWTQLRRATRVSIPTLIKVFEALKSMFFLREVPTLGTESKSTFYLEDQGEALFLTNEFSYNLQNFSLYLYQHIRTQWMYRPELKISLHRWKSRNGPELPFVLKSEKNMLGIIPLLEENPTAEAMGSASSLLRKNPQAKVIYVHPGKKDLLLSSRERIVPIGCLF